ncbi:hypothetical protein DP939_10520 [Spongiactinospora rosea]|uniref:Uncharacterized protein n=1 Tax=Spongiactinospora rosea TaxID=2248750 RepID=A0A366M1Y4_9ACTN|nr:hypothetical protein [Spongiactinospora rosea]RBQ20238.1 hypothetical protein DP939_10520 [Spongiactinospora rosea]
MKVILDVAGVLCIVQAVGGALNNLLGSSTPSWFLVNHIPALDGHEIFASIVVGVLGVALCAAARAAGRSSGREEG